VKLRSGLYRTASALGTAKAWSSGPVAIGRRAVRVRAYRGTGTALRAAGCALPVGGMLAAMLLY
jgi:hypothetical protein